jgi:hypothetical protein
MGFTSSDGKGGPSDPKTDARRINQTIAGRKRFFPFSRRCRTHQRGRVSIRVIAPVPFTAGQCHGRRLLFRLAEKSTTDTMISVESACTVRPAGESHRRQRCCQNLYIRSHMSSTSDRSARKIVRTLALSEEGSETVYSELTAEQRVLMVWPLTLTAWKFAKPDGFEPRLQRHVARIERG